MRLPLFASLVVLLGLVLPARAQRTAESVSQEMIKDVLTQLDCKWTVEDWKYSVDFNNRKFTLFRLDNGKRLLLKASIKSQPSLETINRYNEKTAVTTRAVRYEKFGTILESGIDCQLGVSEPGLKKWLTRFTIDAAEFEKFIASDKTTGNEPKIIAKGEKQKPPLNIKPGSDDHEFVVTFPSGQTNWETAWKVLWDIETSKQATDQGLKFGSSNRPLLFKIKKAYFKPGQNAEWIQVIEDAHPQELYVPYFFKNTRFYDLRDVGGYVTLSAKEGGAVSQLMGKAKHVIAELRDTGTAYKHGDLTRRSEELTLLANFQASNYTYMIEYGFRDDGGIVFRHSPTGYNYFSHMDAAHMHGSYWRIGMKLGPEGNNETNQVYVSRLPTDPKEQGLDGGKVILKEITRESFVDWNPQEFTRIRVTNPNYSIVSTAPAPEPMPVPNPKIKPKLKLKPRPPQDVADAAPTLPISYDLVTYPQGVARHARFKDEKFSLHDFWITRQDGPEKMYVRLGDYFFNDKDELNPKLLNLDKKNVVIWHSSSGLHVPRPEDGILGGNSRNNGQATIYWTTFELRPRNLFPRTPHYGNGSSGPAKIDAKKSVTPANPPADANP